MQRSPHVVVKYTTLWETMKRANREAVSDLEWEINLHPFSWNTYKSLQYPNMELSRNDLQNTEAGSRQMSLRNASGRERFNFMASMTVLE